MDWRTHTQHGSPSRLTESCQVQSPSSPIFLGAVSTPVRVHIVISEYEYRRSGAGHACIYPVGRCVTYIQIRVTPCLSVSTPTCPVQDTSLCCVCVWGGGDPSLAIVHVLLDHRDRPMSGPVDYGNLRGRSQYHNPNPNAPQRKSALANMLGLFGFLLARVVQTNTFGGAADGLGFCMYQREKTCVARWRFI